MSRSAAWRTPQGLAALVLVWSMGCGRPAEEADAGSGAEAGASARIVGETALASRATGPTEPSPRCDPLPSVSASQPVMPNQTKVIPLTAPGVGLIAQLTVPRRAIANEATFTLSVPDQTERVVVDLEARDANGPVTTFAEDLELRLFVRSSCTPQGPSAGRTFVIYRIPAPGDSTLTNGAGDYDQNGNHVTRRLRSFSGYMVADG